MNATEEHIRPTNGGMIMTASRVPLVAYVLVAALLGAYLLSAAYEVEFYFFLILLGVIVMVTAFINFDVAFLYIPITLTNPYTLSETGTRLHLSEYILLILFGVWFVRMLPAGRKYIVPRRHLIMAGVIIAIAVLSLSTAKYVGAGIQQIIRYVEILVVFLFVTVNSVRDARRIEQIFTLLIIGGILASLVGLVQFVTGESTMGETRRIFGWHGGGYGALIGSTLVLCASALTYSRDRWARFWALVAIPFAGLALVLSQTRAWIGAFCIVLALMFLRVRREVIVRIAAVLGIIIVAVVIILQTNAFGLVQENLVQRAVQTAFRFGASAGQYSASDLSLLLRLNVWRRGLEYFVGHPVLGIGVGNLRFSDYITAKLGDPSGDHIGYVDNQYIQFLAECGVVAGLLWILYVVMAIRDGSRTVRAAAGSRLHGVALGFYSSFLIFAIGSLFWVITPHHELFALMILNIGLLYNIQSLMETSEWSQPLEHSEP